MDHVFSCHKYFLVRTQAGLNYRLNSNVVKEFGLPLESTMNPTTEPCARYDGCDHNHVNQTCSPMSWVWCADKLRASFSPGQG